MQYAGARSTAWHCVDIIYSKFRKRDHVLLLGHWFCANIGITGTVFYCRWLPAAASHLDLLRCFIRISQALCITPFSSVRNILILYWCFLLYASQYCTGSTVQSIPSYSHSAFSFSTCSARLLMYVLVIVYMLYTSLKWALKIVCKSTSTYINCYNFHWQLAS